MQQKRSRMAKRTLYICDNPECHAHKTATGKAKEQMVFLTIPGKVGEWSEERHFCQKSCAALFFKAGGF
ncbi:hypothetical protein SEA_KEELAN_62 [Gordonia phage Keelan]|nr:hypothetical protein SEA_KEELAN_62 [Gordonia phage Keelan]